MEPKLKSYLEKHQIKYIEHKHPAVFTVEESKRIDKKMPNVFHTKNLFLKNNNNKFFLISMSAEKRLNLKSLKEKLNARKKLSFGSPEQLKEHLNITPGSVSIFCMIHAKEVTLILDKQVWLAPKAGFHPNTNTSTLEITHNNLEKFYRSLNCKKQILEL